jgi:hypothetical protein
VISTRVKHRGYQAASVGSIEFDLVHRGFRQLATMAPSHSAFRLYLSPSRAAGAHAFISMMDRSASAGWERSAWCGSRGFASSEDLGRQVTVPGRASASSGRDKELLRAACLAFSLESEQYCHSGAFRTTFEELSLTAAIYSETTLPIDATIQVNAAVWCWHS